MRNKILLEIAGVVFFLFVLHVIFGEYLSFYIKIWWWDLLTHFLGGFFIGMAVLWFFIYSGYFHFIFPRRNFLIILIILLTTFSIAVGWEIFEYLFGFSKIFYYPEGYRFDTLVDVIMGMAGSLVGSFYFLAKKYHFKN